MLLALPGTARAFDWSLKLEPGLAVPVTQPQARLFDVGGAASVKALFGLGPYVDVGPVVGFVGLPASHLNPSSDTGVGWQLGGGFRFKRPHDAGRGLGAVSPWLDTDALYVRTGPLNRFGFDVGAGFAFPIGEQRRYWLGPFVRYFQIVQPERQAFDNHDAKIVIAGISLEVGSPHARYVEHAVVTESLSCPAAVACPPIARLRDRDEDGVPDMFDRCPDVAGPIDNQGCPLYSRIIVKEDKLELKEHIQFAWDQAIIETDTFPMLDEVVRALQDNRSFHVRIEGHTSSEGQDDHNQTLSEKRAEAVLNYLVSHGVAKDRLGYKGFSSSVPIESNVTAQGREANRRVVFNVELIILNKGSAQ